MPHTHRRTEGFKRQKNCFEVFIQYSDDVVSGKKCSLQQQRLDCIYNPHTDGKIGMASFEISFSSQTIFECVDVDNFKLIEEKYIIVLRSVTFD